jgi:NAD(P)-dependent dehydrogenase (short-subunit alcohol dehydrogenase family)
LVQALAEAVLASGHNLVATAVDPEPLRELVERYGDQLRIVPMEVTDASAAETAIEATLGAFGRLDVMVLDLEKWRSRLTDQAFQKVVAPPKLAVRQGPNDSAHASP